MLSGHGSGGLGKATNQITGRGANEKGGDGSAENHDAHHENPFLQFLSPSWYVLNFQPLFLLFRTLLSVDVLCICTTFLWWCCVLYEFNWSALMKWKTAKLCVLCTLVQCTAILALFQATPRFCFAAVEKPEFSPQLRDKSGSGLGTRLLHYHEILCSNLFQAFAQYTIV